MPLSPDGRRRRLADRVELVGDSTAFRRALHRARRLAKSDLPLLISGETGTGKELIARWVHRHSPRRGRPFVPVNCAAMSEELVLSELFGHARGAFTGADRQRSGLFAAADGGTLFLDEVAELSARAQSQLLRALATGETRPVGESSVRHVDTRVVAATHGDLAERVRDGGFREDLYFRLRVGWVELPPLRERLDDILPLAEHFLRESVEEPPRLTPAARRKLMSYSWPGNVRELENVVRLGAALAASGPLRQRHLEVPIPTSLETPVLGHYRERVDEFRRRLLREAIAECSGNQAAAARRLGLSRQAVSYLTRQLGLR